MDNKKLNSEEEIKEIEEVVTDEEIEAELEAELGVEEAEEAEEKNSEEQVEPKTVIVEKWQCTKCETINETEVCSVCGEPCELVEIEELITEDIDGTVNYEDNKAGLSKGAKIGIIAGGAVVAILAVIAILFGTGTVNVYEKNIFTKTEYLDTTGRTIEEVAQQSGYTVKEYKEMYDLPALMPKSTSENAAMNQVPVSYLIKMENRAIERQKEDMQQMAEFTGEKIDMEQYKPFTIDDFRKQYGLSDKITEKSTIGEAKDEVKLSTVWGLDPMTEEDANREFIKKKVYYGLADYVTPDTKYGKVRKQIEEKKVQERINPEKAAKDMDKAEEEMNKIAPTPAPVPEIVEPEVIEPEVADPEVVEPEITEEMTEPVAE